MKDTNKGFIYMLIGVFLFSILSITVKIVYSMGISETTLTPLFSLFVFIITFVYNMIKNRDKLKIEKRKIKFIILQGLIGVALVNTFLNRSLLYIDASIAIMLLYINCIFIFLYKKIFRNNKFNITSIISMIIVIGGLILASNPQTAGKVYNTKGLIFGLCASLCYTFYNLNIEENLNDIDTNVVIMYSQLISFIFLISIYNPIKVFDFNLTISNISLLFIMAFSFSFLPMFFIMKGINNLGAYKSSVIGTMELPVTAIIAFIALGETMTILQIIGMVMVVLGAIKIKNT